MSILINCQTKLLKSLFHRTLFHKLRHFLCLWNLNICISDSLSALKGILLKNISNTFFAVRLYCLLYVGILAPLQSLKSFCLLWTHLSAEPRMYLLIFIKFLPPNRQVVAKEEWIMAPSKPFNLRCIHELCNWCWRTR